MLENAKMQYNNLPMNEIFSFQVSHCGRNLGGHVEENSRTKLPFFRRTVPEVVQQIPLAHKLRDDVEWRFSSTNTSKETVTKSENKYWANKFF